MHEPKNPAEAGKNNLFIHNMLANMDRTFLPPGSTIGKYRIIEEIDRGGMAVVYKAIQLDLDREVALKIMPSNISLNRRFMERFMSEAHAVAKLSHPNIVSIHEVAMENNVYYLAMEYIPGQNLFYYLNFNKPKLIDVLEIVSRLADALFYAHQQKIIHRDLKLNNVIMKDRLTPVLIDFGLAKALEDEGDGGITRTGEVMGSPAYMAPERMLGGMVDHRSDICSLGIMLYEMLTFKNPYLDQRNLHQTALNVMEAAPIPPRKLVQWLPPEIEAITLKAMAKDPQNRYQTMEEFRADIQRYQRNEQVLAQQPTLRSQVRRFLQHHWPAVSIVTLVVMFSVLFGASLYIQNKKEQSHWQMFFSDRFGGKLNSEDWHFFPASSPHENDSSAWSVKNGVLTGQSTGLSYVRLERPFNRDVKIEFDIGALDMDLYNAGFFLFGDNPETAYGFHINRGGEGDCGITFPGNDFLFQMADPSKITIAPVNHIIIEKIQNTLTFSINGVVVSKVCDYLPPLGKDHERLGYFVRGCPVWFDNFRIYRRAIPLTPSPTFVADRFWERGDFYAALEEYRTLLVDFKASDRAKEVRLKIADCLVRLGRFSEAASVIRASVPSRGKDEALDARRLFLEGIIDNGQGLQVAADSVSRLLADLYPASGANNSAMVFAINRIDSCIKLSELDLAEKEIGTFVNQYSRYGDIWGRLSLLVMEKYIQQESLDSAIAVVERVLALQDKNSGMFTSAKTALAKIYLSIGRKERANDLFNQSITGHLSSEGVWESWMGLAGIYEYDFSYPEATTIYNKIYGECPKTLPVEWMAAVKLGELAAADTSSNKVKYFEEVAKGMHPFPLPRLIARFYLGQINESQFRTSWNTLFPGDYLYLYYFARKAMFKKETVVARIYLEDLKNNVSQMSWDYYLACKVYNNLAKW